MSPLEWLGLPADADERMVKRAYAQRLRTTRPEDDPAGFQQLHEIYQAALAQCRHATGKAAPPTPAAPPPAPTDASALPATADTPPTRPAAPVFDSDDFHAAMLRHAATGDPAALQSWLDNQPALWSLRLKAQVGHALLARLHRETPPMPPACLAILLRFFDLDHALAGHDPLALQRLQRRMQLAWELQPEHRDALARRLDMQSPAQRQVMERWLRRLALPFDARQAVLLGLNPEASGDLAKFVAKLSLEHPDDLPPSCNPRQVGFWLQAVDRSQVGKPRLLIGLTRCMAALFCATLAGVLLGVVGRTPPESFSFTVLAWVVALAALPCLIWVGWMAWLPLEHWHAKPEYLPVRWPWLNLLLIPLLCTAGLVGAKENPFGLLLLVLTLWLAIRRCLLRGSSAIARVAARVVWYAFFLGGLALKAYLSSDGQRSRGIDLGDLLVAIALLFWGFDLWRHRKRLRVTRST